MNITATILLQVMVYLLEGLFLESASIDEVSMPAGIAVASMLLRINNISQLPLYWRVADMLMEVYVPCLLAQDRLI